MSFPITEEQVLAIKRPEDLFPATIEEGKTLFRDLARRWHPDHGGSDKVFAHINWLKDEAFRKIGDKTWGGKSVIRIESTEKVAYQIQYLRSRPFDFGHMYIGETQVVWMFDPVHKDLISGLEGLERMYQFGSDKMKTDIIRSLPQNIKVIRCDDEKVMVRVPKAKEFLSLTDVLEHMGGKLDPKHAAWIGSALHNLACWLNYSSLVHGDITADNVWIDPADHSLALLGGWWFSARAGASISKVSARTYDHLPYKVKVQKKADPLTDLELIRVIILELLNGGGDDVLRAWLQRPAAGTAPQVYKAWHKLLEDVFGKRRFTVWELKQEDIY